MEGFFSQAPVEDPTASLGTINVEPVQSDCEASYGWPLGIRSRGQYKPSRG